MIREYPLRTLIMHFLQFQVLFRTGLLAGALAMRAAEVGAPIPVTITVDAARPGIELTPIWRFFGADEPNYAHMKWSNQVCLAFQLHRVVKGVEAKNVGNRN